MKLKATKLAVLVAAQIVVLMATQSFAGEATARSAERGRPPTAEVRPEDRENPADYLPAACRDYDRELTAVRSCSADSECGQVIKGTSCGCTRDLVARKDAELTKFRQLKEIFQALAAISSEWPQECSHLFMISPCDCPPADGFACVDHACTWNYSRRPTFGVPADGRPQTVAPR